MIRTGKFSAAILPLSAAQASLYLKSDDEKNI